MFSRSSTARASAWPSSYPRCSRHTECRRRSTASARCSRSISRTSLSSTTARSPLRTRSECATSSSGWSTTACSWRRAAWVPSRRRWTRTCCSDSSTRWTRSWASLSLRGNQASQVVAAHLGGKRARVTAFVVRKRRVRPALDQESHHLATSAHHRSVDRRGGLGFRIDLGAGRDEQVGGGHAATYGGEIKHRQVVHAPRLREPRPGPQLAADPVHLGQRKRGEEVDWSAARYEVFDDRAIAHLRRCLDRRLLPHRRDIDELGMGLEDLLDPGQISVRVAYQLIDNRLVRHLPDIMTLDQRRARSRSSSARVLASLRSAKRMKRALGPVPSRCGCFALSWINWPRLNIRVTCLLATCTKLAMLSLQANVIVPYCTRSVMRSSAPRMISRTRRIAGPLLGFLSANQRSTSGFFSCATRERRSPMGLVRHGPGGRGSRRRSLPPTEVRRGRSRGPTSFRAGTARRPPWHRKPQR